MLNKNSSDSANPWIKEKQHTHVGNISSNQIWSMCIQKQNILHYGKHNIPMNTMCHRENGNLLKNLIDPYQ